MSDHNQDIDVPNISLKQIKVIGALGRGAKGVVFLVRNELTGDFLALKVILKQLIDSKNNKANKENHVSAQQGSEYRRICFEQEVLSRFHHPLLPRLHGVLSTNRVVGYAIDYCSGRDLSSLRRKQTECMFSDDVIRFYAAELVLALEYVHNLGIVYRDLKPENIMIQENGHIMLVDFDLSTKLPPPRSSPQASPASPLSPPKTRSARTKRFTANFNSLCNSGISPEDRLKHSVNSNSTTDSESSEKSNSFVGTEEYVAPEIILGKGHDFAVDWWSLGVVLYEMLYGKTPFRGTNRKETFYRILSKVPELVGEATPLRRLIGKLLEKDPKQRIEVEGIKGHGFFKGIDWESVMEVSRPPYIPNNAGNVMEEDTEGIKKNDVELFVQGIFEKEIKDGTVERQVLNPRQQPYEVESVF